LKTASAKILAAAQVRLAAAYFVKAEASGDRRHVARARLGLAKAREQLVMEAASFGRELRDTLGEQQALLRRLSGGGIQPAEANARNHALTARLNGLRQMIADANALLGSSPEQAAEGAPDLPLDEYYWRVRSSPLEAWMPTRRGFLTWLAAMGAVGVSGVAYVEMRRGAGGVTLSVRPVQPAGPFIIELRNGGSAPVPFVVPGSNASGQSQDYGLSVMTAEKDAAEFQLVDCLECWRWRGAALVEPHTFSLEPKLPVQIEFRPGPLRNVQIRADRFRFVITAPGGAVVAEHGVQIE